MERTLRKRPALGFWACVSGAIGEVLGFLNGTPDLRGDVSGIRGDVSGIRGDVSGIRGDVSGIRGDVSGIRGDVSGIGGDVSDLRGDVSGIGGDVSELSGDVDACNITDADRQNGIEVTRLVQMKYIDDGYGKYLQEIRDDIKRNKLETRNTKR